MEAWNDFLTTEPISSYIKTYINNFIYAILNSSIRSTGGDEIEVSMNFEKDELNVMLDKIYNDIIKNLTTKKKLVKLIATKQIRGNVDYAYDEETGKHADEQYNEISTFLYGLINLPCLEDIHAEPMDDIEDNNAKFITILYKLYLEKDEN